MFYTISPRIFAKDLFVLALILPHLGAWPAYAQQCQPKTAGYFKQMPAFSRSSPSPVELAGITESLTGEIGNPARARAIISEDDKGNCLACHRLSGFGNQAAQGNVGPALKGVGRRYTEAQLRQIMVDPSVLFPKTVMPAYHKPPAFDRVPEALADKPVLSADEVEDVVAFLKNLK